jgi:hypothetical protein
MAAIDIGAERRVVRFSPRLFRLLPQPACLSAYISLLLLRLFYFSLTLPQQPFEFRYS